MQQLISVWNALTPARRVVVTLATLAMFAAVLLLARAASTPGMALLYSGLEPGPAGEVVAALEQRGIVHEVRGGAIYVDAGARDSLRMSLAAEGLPANGAAGYEILDGLSGFGTTAQMFDAAYWRAKEGELARTIVTAPQIRAARVHIASGVSRPFQGDRAPTASVTVTTAAGALPAAQAEALRHLVASAVAGLPPANVAVIDSEAGLIGGEGDDPAAEAGGRAAQLKANVQRLLEARVGPGNAVVEVSIDTVMDTETLVERRFDPEGRVAISTETVETNNAETSSGNNGVTVASNLPDGEAAGAEQSSAQNSETRERVNFEVSETKREVIRGPGAIRRISVAALVNGAPGTDADGQQVVLPRPQEELDALGALIRSAVGYDEARGDAVTINSMAFTLPAEGGTLVVTGLMQRLGLDPMTLLQLAALALVSLVLGLFVVRPVLASAVSGSASELPPPFPALAEPAGLPDLSELPELPAFAPPEEDEDPVARLRQLIEDRQEDTAEILRSWIEAPEENA